MPYLTTLTYLVFSLSSLSIDHRVLTGLAYALGTVTLYWLMKYLTRRELPSIASALLYSLIPSFAFPIAPAFAFVLWGLVVMAFYGEGPHILGLALIPLAVIAFIRTLRESSFKNHDLTAVTISTAALANLIALFSLAIILVITYLTEVNFKNWLSNLKFVMACAALTCGI